MPGIASGANHISADEKFSCKWFSKLGSVADHPNNYGVSVDEQLNKRVGCVIWVDTKDNCCNGGRSCLRMSDMALIYSW
jgi:hypothetical protein